jgi:hypothetical protein
MNNRNKKMISLMKEGFEFQTLKNMSDAHINMLHRKFIKEEEGTVQQTKDLEDLEKQALKTKEALKGVTGEGEVKEEEINEKSVSKQQQKIMGLALSVKRGDTPRSKVSKKVLDMVDGMTEKELEDFASTKHKGLPKKKESNENLKKVEESIISLLEKKSIKTISKKDFLDEVEKESDNTKKGLPEFLKFKNLNIKFRNE